jgi:hypothetical protein
MQTSTIVFLMWGSTSSRHAHNGSRKRGSGARTPPAPQPSEWGDEQETRHTYSHMCEYCPFAKLNGMTLQQSPEQSRECVYEKGMDSCFNGGIECVLDSNGTSCVLSRRDPGAHTET